MHAPLINPSEHSLRLSQVLGAEVRVRATKGSSIKDFRYLETQSADVIYHAGDAMFTENPACASANVNVILLKTGNCTIRHERGTFSLQPGELFAFHGGSALEVAHDRPYELMGLRVQRSDLERLAPEWSASAFVPFDAENPEARALFRVMDALVGPGQSLSTTSARSLGDVAAVILSQALRAAETSEPPDSNREMHKRRVKQFCRENLGRPDLSIGLISQQLGISRVASQSVV